MTSVPKTSKLNFDSRWPKTQPPKAAPRHNCQLQPQQAPTETCPTCALLVGTSSCRTCLGLMLHSPPPMTMAPAPASSSSSSSSSRALPKRTDSLLSNPNYSQLFSTIEDEVRDCRRVGTHGQEEDLRQALDRMIGRVEELVCFALYFSIRLLFVGMHRLW